MKKPHMPEIRALLRAHTDGLTIAEIHERMPHVKKPETLRKCLERMPDAYIDRWTKTRNARGQYSAIWCVVVPPKHCPYPTERFDKPATRWVPLEGAQA